MLATILAAVFFNLCNLFYSNFVPPQVKIQAKNTRISELEYNEKLVQQDNDKLQYEMAALRSSMSEYKNYYSEAKRDTEKLQADIIEINQKRSHLEAHSQAMEEQKERYRNEVSLVELFL